MVLAELSPYPHARLPVGGEIYVQSLRSARAVRPRFKFNLSMLHDDLKIGPHNVRSHMISADPGAIFAWRDS
jgi:hypothetical protein